MNGGNGGGGSGGGAGGGGAGSGSGGGGGGSGGSGGGTSGRSSTAARDSRRQTRVIRTGRDRGSGLLGSQPQPVIPASVIPEELITQVRKIRKCQLRVCGLTLRQQLSAPLSPPGPGRPPGQVQERHHSGTPEDQFGREPGCQQPAEPGRRRRR